MLWSWWLHYLQSNVLLKTIEVLNLNSNAAPACAFPSHLFQFYRFGCIHTGTYSKVIFIVRLPQNVRTEESFS